MDFTSNCVFIDEAAFHINSKRNFFLSKNEERTIISEPGTRSKTTTILGAISSLGAISISQMVLPFGVSPRIVRARIEDEKFEREFSLPIKIIEELAATPKNEITEKF
ncbi:hypothetical protein A0J61_06517 [Choanephora cucurbitarum]|uniref:Tc1-like transposase DDE domain-containing protein n=1 Tax=Choanephora cucurbitarum TaxID=101091 RepID=A0A1C7N9Z2_9FUNG|nr:hypothetical protein A0J61_06517 [Choanephora cucurbitarum]